MIDCQQGLITHLSMQFLNEGAKTVKAYAGELREAHKLTQLSPLILVKYGDGFPIAQDGYHNFDVLTVTDSQAFDKISNQNTNLQLASDVLKFIKENPLFVRVGGGTYYINPEKVRAETLLIIERFNIIRLQLYIDDRTGN